MSGQAWLFGAAGVAALVVIGSRLRSGDDVSADVDAWTPVEGPPRSMRSLAEAIATAEGFFSGGSLARTFNNPGNLKLSSTPQAANGLSMFESLDQGWAALYKQLGLIASGGSAYYSPSMTIRQMGNIWAPTSDRNVPGAWAANVARYLGVSVDTPLSQVLA